MIISNNCIYLLNIYLIILIILVFYYKIRHYYYFNNIKYQQLSDRIAGIHIHCKQEPILSEASLLVSVKTEYMSPMTSHSAPKYTQQKCIPMFNKKQKTKNQDHFYQPDFE